jgi:hypothetical protein
LHDYLPKHPLQIKIEDLAYWFWFSQGIAVCQTFLFFKNNPVLGTLASYLPTFGFALFLGSSFLVSKRFKFTNVLQTIPAKSLVLLILWAGTTLWWTRVNSLFSAFGYWTGIAISVLVVSLLLSLGDTDKVACKSLQGYVWSGLGFALVALLSNSTTADGRLGNEDFLHPNAIGNQMAIASFCASYLILQTKTNLKEHRCYTAILLILLFTLLRSMSKTCIVAFLLAFPVYLAVTKISFQKKIALLWLTGGLVLISSATLSEYIGNYISDRGGENLTTATGRTRIWELTWDLIQQRPFLGYGFQSFRDVADQIVGVRLINPHNEFLDVWVNLGLIGLTLTLITYIGYILLLKRALRSGLPQAAFGLALLIYSLVRGLTEASITPGEPMVYPIALMMLVIGWLSPVKRLALRHRDRHR